MTCLFLFSFFGANADAQTQQKIEDVKSYVVDDRVQLAKPFQFSISVTHASTGRVSIPLKLPFNTSELIEIDRQRKNVSEIDGQKTTQFGIRLQPWIVGDLRIPEIAVTYEEAGVQSLSKTAAISVYVHGVVNDDSEGLRPMAPPFSVRRSFSIFLFVVWAGIIAFVGALIYFIVIRRKQGFGVSATNVQLVSQDPWSSALMELKILDDSVRDDFKIKQYYMSLSEILRRHLGDRYRFSALDLTTKELCEALYPHIPDDISLDVIKGWLGQCDLVKYARQNVPLENGKQMMFEIKRWLEASRPNQHQGQSLE